MAILEGEGVTTGVEEESSRTAEASVRITLEGVGRRYGSIVALRRVDAVLQGGEVVGVEGRNGSGKSTLIGIVGGRLAPSSGSVRYEPGAHDAANFRARIGWVAHETLVYSDLSTRQNLELTAELYGVEPTAAWEAQAERFGLAAFADRPVRVQSRGQRQRLSLARALVHRPSVLLLDEPTSGLDREGVEQLVRVVQEEVRRGCLVVVVSHDADVVSAVATRRMRLDRGCVVSDSG